MNPLVDPKKIKVKDMKGNIIHVKLGQVSPLDWRRIFVNYVPSAMPKIGNYEENEKLMLTMFSDIEVRSKEKNRDGEYFWTRLTSKELINAQIPDGEALIEIEAHMVGHNTKKYHPEKISSLLKTLNQNLPQQITSTLTRFVRQFSQKK